MSDSIKAGVSAEELSALLAKLPVDAADSVISKLRLTVAAQEADLKRREIVAEVSRILSDVAGDIVALVPPGKALTVLHVAASKDADGKDVAAHLAFDIDMGGGLSSLGSSKSEGAKGGRKGSGAIMRLDGAEVKADNWRKMLDAVNERLKARGTEPLKVPTSSFNARALLMQACPKIKGLEYVGDAPPAAEVEAK